MFTWCFWEKTLNDPAVFWPMTASVFTLAIVGVAWWQLGALARTSQADFIFRLKSDFFTEEARRLLFLVEEGLLQFEDSEILSILKRNDPSLRCRFEELGVKGSTISTYVVDDVLLGPLEDVGAFLDGRLVTEKHAYDMFYTYVKSCSENAEIRKYIQSNRRELGDSDVYSDFDDLYKRLRRMEPKL
jgi:hypothetical protein